MTVQEWLNRGWHVEREIKRLTKARAAAYGALLGVGEQDGEKVQTSKKNVTEERYLKYLAYDEQLDKSIDELYEVRQEIFQVINEIEDNRLRELLIARYISFHKWEEIADALCYDIRHVFRLHRLALEAAGQLIPEDRL